MAVASFFICPFIYPHSIFIHLTTTQVKPRLKLRNFIEILKKFMVNRPLSPHIQIYRPQITSILSILHRFTGIGLVFGVLLFCVGFVSFSISEAAWNEFITIWHSVGGKFWQWPLIFSLHYHSINGIRHLMWDIGYGFEIKAVTQTGIITIFLSFVTTLLFAYFCLIF